MPTVIALQEAADQYALHSTACLNNTSLATVVRTLHSRFPTPGVTRWAPCKARCATPRPKYPLNVEQACRHTDARQKASTCIESALSIDSMPNNKTGPQTRTPSQFLTAATFKLFNYASVDFHTSSGERAHEKLLSVFYAAQLQLPDMGIGQRGSTTTGSPYNPYSNSHRVAPSCS